MTDAAIIRALCIVAYGYHNPDWAGWHPHDKRLKWAWDIVRTIAEQPLDAIDNAPQESGK